MQCIGEPLPEEARCRHRLEQVKAEAVRDHHHQMIRRPDARLQFTRGCGRLDPRPACEGCRRIIRGMKFCPRCGSPLIERPEGGRLRQMCPTAECAYVHYGEHSIGTGAVVFREGRILLIERRTATRSWWQIPGGFVEVDEPIDVAIEREVLEETGVTARINEVLGFRHAPGLQPDRPVSNIYVVFRLEAVSGEPRADMDESFDAGFYTHEEIAAMPTVSSMSHWAIEQAMLAQTNPGLIVEPHREGLHRPGHTIYGLNR
ncbi:MAG: NUDIX domain-containing protein [Chloroflexi bacterium]|nr:MAG: NUDIX domain-containing protein [Chloroflexota bacterium]